MAEGASTIERIIGPLMMLVMLQILIPLLNQIMQMLSQAAAAAAPPPEAPEVLLEDNFDDNVLDTSKWTIITLGTGEVSETNGRIECSVPADGDEAGIYTRKLDLSDCDITVDADVNTATWVQLVITTQDPPQLGLSADNYYFIGLNSRLSLCDVGKKIAGTSTTLYSESWAASSNKLRIKVKDGIIYFYEGDNLRYSESIELTGSMMVLIKAVGESPNLGTGYFDNFRITTPAV